MMGRHSLADDVRMSISGGSVRGIWGLAADTGRANESLWVIGASRTFGFNSDSSMYSSPPSSSSACGGGAAAAAPTSSSMGHAKSLALTPR